MKRSTAIMLVKLLTGLSLFTGIIAIIFLIFLFIKPQLNPHAPTPALSVTPTETSQTEDTFCGGSKDIQCPTGYVCVFEGGKYLTEGGKCVKQQPRPRSAEGEFCGGIAAIQCTDGYICNIEGNYPDAGGTCIKKNN